MPKKITVLGTALSRHMHTCILLNGPHCVATLETKWDLALRNSVSDIHTAKCDLFGAGLFLKNMSNQSVWVVPSKQCPNCFLLSQVCLAIAHYSHPADIHLLFGFEFQGRRFYESKGTARHHFLSLKDIAVFTHFPNFKCHDFIYFHFKQEVFSVFYFPGRRVNGSTPRGGLHTPMFDRPSDWDREIKRTGASEWRVCSINERYAISQRFSVDGVLHFYSFTSLGIPEFKTIKKTFSHS